MQHEEDDGGGDDDDAGAHHAEAPDRLGRRRAEVIRHETDRRRPDRSARRVPHEKAPPVHARHAGHEGAGAEYSFGASIRLPLESEPNIYIQGNAKLINFKYFFTRKLTFIKESDAFALLPGGFGTMDEAFELLTLMQTGKLAERNLILIYGREYWDKVLNWRAMVRAGTISEREYGLLKFADTVDEAFARVREDLEHHHLKLENDLEE